MTVKDDLGTAIAELVSQIKARPGDPALDAQVRELANTYGQRRVYGTITDALCEGDGTYSQHRQDCLLRRDWQLEITSSGMTPVVLTDIEPQVLWLVRELVPGDAFAIKRSARLSGLEFDVWQCWLDGLTIKAMAERIRKPKRARGHYSESHLRDIRHGVLRKVWNCPYLAWRTCHAQDIHRVIKGRDSRPPNYVSLAELAGESSTDTAEGF